MSADKVSLEYNHVCLLCTDCFLATRVELSSWDRKHGPQSLKNGLAVFWFEHFAEPYPKPFKNKGVECQRGSAEQD